jgi:hypothetical protein
MKTLKELRSTNPTESAEEITSSVKYFKKQNIDWDVFLPSIGKNLQRPLVWSLDQKRELIMSVLIGRHIPHCTILDIINPENGAESIWQIIDGKQRLSTLVDFTLDKFTLLLEDKEYLFSELPEDYQRTVEKYNFRFYRIIEQYNSPVSDQMKIDWFRFINHSGTPQEKHHMESLSRTGGTSVSDTIRKDFTEKFGEEKTERILSFFEEIFNDLKEMTHPDYPQSILFYKEKDGEKVGWMEQDQKNGILWCTWAEFWSFFKNEIGIDHSETQYVVKTMVEQYTERKVGTPGTNGIPRVRAGWNSILNER